jgi:hypothetical protein
MAQAGISWREFECHGYHRPRILGLTSDLRWQWNHRSKVIMKAKVAIIAFGALVLITNEANAQHRTKSGWRPLRMVEQSYGYVPQSRAGHRWPPGVYESYSLGRQSYPNPDRGPYPALPGAAYF